MPSRWELYEYQPAFIVGFHGCDAEIGEGILSGRIEHLESSCEKWDWLGHGIYFWAGNPQRALAWAEKRKVQGRIDTPFVLGAIIDLKHCLDLLDSSGLQEVKEAYLYMKNSFAKAAQPLPENAGKDKAARMLDCLVMNSLHDYRAAEGRPEYDSVRAMFPEGEELYPDAGFKDRNHIQICIRDARCIKGYFRPIASLPAG
jgi:hypothetical protein